ncbi:DUF4317 domain-containing protein [Eubacterium sp. AF15-50]|uniref:DUF4317 domain-containing protein n=1 Tax=Eubacterium sp. AF15-50 TaxID=2293103 RepID=UPI002671D48E|nr:DUF4317 domain-containing protein [Eubacterium sp. AF15-50]
MDKKSIGELRRRLKKDSCTFTKMCGCYVNDSKNKVIKLDEIFLNLEDEEYYKYLEIAKKVLSTNVGNNILELDFPLEEEQPGGHQQFLLGIKKSGLKDQGLLDAFYDMVIEKYDSLGNYLILLFHDVYDVMTKTTDNNKLDESEEVYEYIICAICPMILSKPGLGYNKSDMRIGTLNREWMVGMPETGFIFPAFNERSSDIHSVLMYTADSKNPHNELIQDILGCREKLTFVQKQNVLCDMVSDVTSEDDLKEVMESVNIELAQISDSEPETVVNEENIKSALTYAGIEENKADKIGKEYISAIDKDELPLLGDIIPNKAVKAVKDNNEKVLLKEEIKELNRKIAQAYDTEGSDIIIKVNDEKRELIRQEDIDGETYLVIPISQNDSIKIN